MFPILVRPVYVPVWRPVSTTSILSGNTFTTGAVTITGNGNVVGSQAGNTVQR